MPRAVLAIWAALMTSGCDDAAPGAKPGPDPLLAMRSVCQKLAAIWCESGALCQPATFAADYGGPETCLERQASLCERSRFGAGTLETPESVAACAAAWYSELSGKPIDERCRTWLQREIGRNPPAECVRKGTLPEGAACLTGAQCSSKSCATAGLCGRCQPPALAYEACFEDGDCAPALACVAQVCTPYGAEGAACGPGMRCHPDLACREQGGELRCAARAKAGEACDPFRDECELWDVGLVCNVVQRRCEPYAFATAGTPCGEREDGSVALCAHGLRCGTIGPDLRTGTCEEMPPDRWPCEVSLRVMPQPVSRSCRVPAVCHERRCQIPDTGACGPGVPP